jgi:hypothetical protein
MAPPQPLPRSVRQHLFEEAGYAEGLGRFAAREVLKGYVSSGADVTDPGFLTDKTLPKHGSVAMHLLGYPQFLVQRPYVSQARRLLQRMDSLADRVAQESRGWLKAFESAMHALTNYGELPGDDLLREAVLATAELNALIRHVCGGDDMSEVMAACDKAAKATGDERRAAQHEVALVRGGAKQVDDDADRE